MSIGFGEAHLLRCPCKIRGQAEEMGQVVQNDEVSVQHEHCIIFRKPPGAQLYPVEPEASELVREKELFHLSEDSKGPARKQCSGPSQMNHSNLGRMFSIQ